MLERHTSVSGIGRGTRQDSDDSSALVAFVEGHHVVGYRGGSALDRVWKVSTRGSNAEGNVPADVMSNSTADARLAPRRSAAAARETNVGSMVVVVVVVVSRSG